MAANLTPQQEADIKKLQNLAQQLNTLQQNNSQISGSMREAEQAIKEVEGLKEEEEIYRAAGMLMYKTTVGKTREKLNEDLELYKIQSGRYKAQIETIQHEMKTLEEKLTKQLGL